MSSTNSGKPCPTDEVQNGLLSSASKKLLQEAFSRAKSLQPQDELPPLFSRAGLKPNTSPTQQPGSTVDAGRLLTTKRNLTERPQSPQPESKAEVRLRNLQNPLWRSGFGSLMIAISSAFNRAFSGIDLDLWASALAECDLIDLQSGISEFIQTAEGFPTPGKALATIKKNRQLRLGIIRR